jgi:hypothetical protein
LKLRIPISSIFHSLYRNWAKHIDNRNPDDG